MIPTSIRRQLPLTYAGIALVTLLALGTVLLVTLRGYYAQREFEHLRGNAQAVSVTVARMFGNGLPVDVIQSQLEGLSFLSQSRIRVLDAAGDAILDSGSFEDRRFITLNSSNPIADRIPPGGLLRWSTTMDVFTRDIDPPDNGTPPEAGDFVVAVAGTPYGFGLNRDITPGQRSDQRISTPLIDPSSGVVGYVELSEGPAYGTEIVEGVTVAFVQAGVVAIAIAGLVGWLVSRRVTAPLLTLTAATEKMGQGNLTTRVQLTRKDEFGRLAQVFNEMAGRVEHTITTLQRFVADAAHELHTPITALHANLDLAASEDDNEKRTGFITHAQDQLHRLEALTQNLLDLSRIESGATPDERTTVDLVQLAREASELYASRAEQKGLAFEFQTPEEAVMARVNEGQIRRVLGNLLDNAIKFTPENGIIRAGVRRQGGTVEVWVQDSGIGIPADDLPFLFSRFRRARNAAAYPGSGLGLAIIKAIIEGHNGKVNVESSPQGTRFWLQLPAAA